MSILASLARAYYRLPNAAPFGYSSEKIGVLISLNVDGSVAHVIDLRDGQITPQMDVPRAEKRASGIASNFLWDKTAYALGITGGDGKRTAREHAAFKERHLAALAGADDAGLAAFRAFLGQWTPEQFTAPVWPDDMKDQNVAFCFEPERRDGIRLHDRAAAKALWARVSAEGEKSQCVCLVTGEPAPVARLHPSIKGVWGAQSSGASIVSFNQESFTSYGHEQGDNAPVSEAATFAYTTALNIFLERDSGHRIQIGDASTVFWADAAQADLAREAESIFGALHGAEAFGGQSGIDEKTEAAKIGTRLAAIRNGQRLAQIAPELTEDVRFHVLALAPNAARLSIRFYFEDDFGRLVENYQRFLDHVRIEPPPRDGYPPLWRYLAETAMLGKRENVPPNLAGEWMRAILSGGRYPMTLLANVLMRIKADKQVNALRAGILKALLIRNFNKGAPMALDTGNGDKGYILGRLFAAYEQVQSAALGSKVNATIKDKYYGSASSTPRKVFALLDKGSANHLSKVGKTSPGYRVNLEKQIGEIMALMTPGDAPYPASLSAEEQALFGLGYYHQRSEFFRSKKDDATTNEGIAK